MKKILAMKSRRRKKGFVYVISAPNGYVKIGSGANPYERFSMIQTGSPLVLTLAYVCECPNPVDVEVAAHEALAADRRHREWFEVDASLAVATIRKLLTAVGIQVEGAPDRGGAGIGARPVLRALINERAASSGALMVATDG